MVADNHSFLASDIKKPTKVGFLLLDHFTMIALASAIEPLRMANQLAAEELYSWSLISENGQSITASDGLNLTPDYSIQNAIEFDLIVVVGGLNITRTFTSKQVSWLTKLARQGVRLGGICTGAYALAYAGLLNNYHCSVHWECMTALQEAFPKVKCNNQLFSIDGDRLTSSGGTAPMDMFLNMIARQHGAKLSNAISDMFICERIRNESDQQRMPLRQFNQAGVCTPKLVDVIELMENNLEEPIELDEMATFVDVSRRQIERMFHKHLDCSPSRYYLRLRLERARKLLKQSSMSIVEISMACGFISTPHFSRCYRKHIGVSPRDERKMAWTAGNISAPAGIIVETSDLHGGTEPLQGEGVYMAHAKEALNNAHAEPSYGSVAM
ncbi:GlxA family transcriptional regulator [Marinomonas transparens]|uniref:GlxA family transcriptional regulator n=1 Tax=Marinomonas transparens TaxID=2795388 RepID=A0A934JSG3_9GAMM|nr:GlxA family transcriptional regulator [Marinomonas transparens]MBJ7537512.1 GlxA family transcriptional regulator [Marinomonas transparens]